MQRMDSATYENQITKGVSNELLDSRISDYHLAEIASDIVEWEILGPQLELTESEQREISEDFHGRYNLQKRQALRVWRWKNGDLATYRSLIRIFCSQKLISLAETIPKLLDSSFAPKNCMVLDTFYHYLCDCYNILHHPSSQQLPSSRLKKCLPFPLQIPDSYFDLTLNKAPLYDLPFSKSTRIPISLSCTLAKNESERLVVYFEGIAGSGKTTLSWYICKEWRKKFLLQHFHLLIYVQMSTPRVQSATCLSEIIPYPDKMFCQQIATAIVDQKGKGVCLLLDGLDETPTPVLDLVLTNLLQSSVGGVHLPFLSFVMTSRPDDRVTKRLESIISSRIIITGFTDVKLHQFFDECLGVGSMEREKLAEKFKVNRSLEGICCHPVINAVIMTCVVHLLEGELPSTQTDLYNLLFCNFLLRHADIRATGQTHPVHRINSILQDVPLELCDMFNKVCKFAHTSLLNNKQLFTTEELGVADVDNNLGLLHVDPKITVDGSERYYSFSHLSLQEFLGAIYISKMERNDQCIAVEGFLNENHFNQILPFYAGLTSLSNEKVLNSLSQAAGCVMSDTKRKAVVFYNCLYESQNELLLKLPQTDVHVMSPFFPGSFEVLEEIALQPKECLPARIFLFSHLPTHLTPTDCLSLGYYINMKSRMPSSTISSMILDLTQCFVTHTGLRVLVTEIKKGISHCTKVGVRVLLAGYMLDKQSVNFLSLKELVKGQSNIKGVALCGCSIIDLTYGLKCLIEGLSNNSSCNCVNITRNHFNSLQIYYLILMLRACPQIRKLDLEGYDVSGPGVVPLLCKAVVLTNIKYLDMTLCNISDSHLLLLGKMINEYHNQSLCCFIARSNPITLSGLSNFLKFFIDNHFSQLRILVLDVIPRIEQEQLLKEINRFRASLKFPSLKVVSSVDMLSSVLRVRRSLVVYASLLQIKQSPFYSNLYF